MVPFDGLPRILNDSRNASGPPRPMPGSTTTRRSGRSTRGRSLEQCTRTLPTDRDREIGIASVRLQIASPPGTVLPGTIGSAVHRNGGNRKPATMEPWQTSSASPSILRRWAVYHVFGICEYLWLLCFVCWLVASQIARS